MDTVGDSTTGGSTVGGPTVDGPAPGVVPGGRPSVQQNTVALFSDVACGWATVALARFYRARREAGLDPDRIRVELRPFLLEEANRAPLPKQVVEAEIGVLGQLEPELGWAPWQDAESHWPVSTLLANEAVRAAARQGPAAAENLDWELRMALFRDSICITMRHEIERAANEVADGSGTLDADQLMADLDRGTERQAMWQDYTTHRDVVEGSPHFFTANGSDVHNPGVEFHWEGEPGSGVPVIDRDAPELVALLVHEAAGGGTTG